MTTTLADLDRARDTALDLSGWGRRFSFYQPRNFAFWGYLLLVAIGFLVFVSTLAREYDAYGQAIGLAVTSFAIYGALFWWFAQHIDHYAKLPAKLMVVAFVWGGFAATGAMAANANDAILALYAKDLRPGMGAELGCGPGGSIHRRMGEGIGPAVTHRDGATASTNRVRRIHPRCIHRPGIPNHRGHHLCDDVGGYPVRRESNWGVDRHHHSADGERGRRAHPVQRNLLRRSGLSTWPAR